MPRKVIQLLVIPESENSTGCYAQGCFMALCDDGTIWDRQYKCDRGEDGCATNFRFEWDKIAGPPDA
jgi:hypothetical protein